jgi:prepilin-type processing-associated H-X9-DG protein
VCGDHHFYGTTSRKVRENHFSPAVHTPNNAAYDCLAGNVGARTAARSYHPGGVNVLFLDGSVRFIKNSVNLNAWRAIATIAGGEVVGADAF